MEKYVELLKKLYPNDIEYMFEEINSSRICKAKMLFGWNTEKYGEICLEEVKKWLEKEMLEKDVLPCENIKEIFNDEMESCVNCFYFEQCPKVEEKNTTSINVDKVLKELKEEFKNCLNMEEKYQKVMSHQELRCRCRVGALLNIKEHSFCKKNKNNCFLCIGEWLTNWEKEQEEIELKPCPFCGGTPMLNEIKSRKYVCSGSTYIRCTACVCMMSGETKDKAVNNWNARIEKQIVDIKKIGDACVEGLKKGLNLDGTKFNRAVEACDDNLEKMVNIRFEPIKILDIDSEFEKIVTSNNFYNVSINFKINTEN